MCLHRVLPLRACADLGNGPAGDQHLGAAEKKVGFKEPGGAQKRASRVDVLKQTEQKASNSRAPENYNQHGVSRKGKSGARK